MIPFWKKMLILGWKCHILRRRNWIISILELVIPIAVFLALSKFYSLSNKKTLETSSPRSYDSLFLSLHDTDIVYTPADNFTNKIMEHVVEDLNKNTLYSTTTRTESKQTEGELVQKLKNKTVSFSFESIAETPEIGVVFSERDLQNYRYTYKIRTTYQSMITNEVEGDQITLLDYLQSAFLRIQVELDKGLLWNAGVKDELPWLFGHLPSKETDLSQITSLLYMGLASAYFFLVVSVIKDVVDEKECGTKELMKVMGVDSWMIWFHWFVYSVMVQLPVIFAATIIFTVMEPVLISACPLVVFLLFILFTINMTVMLFVLSCLFYKTITAINISIIAWIFLVWLMDVLVITRPGQLNILLELAASMFPVANLCWALISLMSFPASGLKWSWSKLFTRGFTKFTLSVGASITMFIVSTIVCTFILFYLDNILPGPYGVPKPKTFVCQWIRKRLTSRRTFEDSKIPRELPENFESVGKNAKVGIMLRGLHKRYGFFKKVVAVEKVDLDIYRGEIMALLGHNGAGKTTTMSMITGMTAPTRGVIVFEGQNITVNKTTFRENLGLCPQHNLYFSKLTVIEQLIFFGMLKGMSYFKSKTSGKSLLYSLNMLDKATTRGSKLSGGMQRRLCLAASLIGNPKVLILDEPTSGLDPETRRMVWDIILRMRGERTVLITTHFMEEADVLGDRIAIMDHGRVVCCGTSLFLKKLFGAGYQVHVLKTPNAPVEDISNVVKQNVPEPQVNVISNIQVDYIIKEESVGKFPALFSDLEAQKSSLGITGITVTCASMEDVFLKVASLPISDPPKLNKGEQERPTAYDFHEFERLKGVKLHCQQLKAMFVKRIIYRKRKIGTLLFNTFYLICLMILFAFNSQITRTKYKEQRELFLNLNVYPDATVLLAYDRNFEGIDVVGEKVARLLAGTVKIFPNISDMEDYIEKSLSDNYNYIQKILFSIKFNRENITIQYHARSNAHAPAIAVNFLSNILLLNNTNGTGAIEAINHPYVYTDASGICDKKKTNPLYLDIFVVYPYVMMFSLLYIVLFGDFLQFIIEERVSGFKHQQFLAGATPPVYWFVNFSFDFCVYFIVSILQLVVFVIFGPGIVLISSIWIGLLLIVIVLQGWSGICITYLFTFFFDSPSTALVVFGLFLYCLGMVPALVLSSGVLNSFPLFKLLANLFSLNPLSATTFCLRYILRAIVLEEFCRVCTDERCPKDSEVLRMPSENHHSGILSYLFILAFTAIFYAILLILVECGLTRKLKLLFMSKEPDFSKPPDADEDVKQETDRVRAFKYEGKNTPLRVESLEKKYICGPKAVDKVSFLVMKGDCFGLLGVNGAGKSTTFKMLTAEIFPDKGDAYIDSFSVKTDMVDYMTSVGYCPQFDAILPSLTGEELLTIIAKIRGISSDDAKNAVAWWLDMMGILEHGGKCCGTYSGGTKRKLSTAMALIGSPEVVFMDEPTTGVDPASRRKLWTVIKQMQKQGQAVVLTSHSMEECEALCTRLTIMVGGRMRCIGSVEYLKTKFGKGFTVLIKLKEHTEEELERLKQDFNKVFVDNTINDEHAILIHYTVLDPNMSLSQLFADLLKFKRDHPLVADFTASNTTLEELFLSFATNKQKRRSPKS